MKEPVTRGFSEEVIPLYDTERREGQLPNELKPVKIVLPMSKEIEQWRNTHGQQSSSV